jgi:hypothetical protein
MKTIKLSDDLYQIPLPKGAEHSHLEWSTDLPMTRFAETHEVIEVPLAKFLSLCLDPAIPMIPHADEWTEKKRLQYIEGQDFNKNSIEMPRVGFSERDSQRSLLQIVLREPKTVWAVGFVNGRHRVRIAEKLGAKYIPVQINKVESAQLKLYLGI